MTNTATIRDLLTFIFSNPESTPLSIGKEFNISTTDAEEILSTLDEDDGTLYHDAESNTYRMEDQDQPLDDVLDSHRMGGGMNLDGPLPVRKTKTTKKKAKTKTKAQKSQKGGKVSTTATATKTKTTKTSKKKTTKRKTKATTVADTTDVESEADTKPKTTKKKTRAKAKPKAKRTTKSKQAPIVEALQASARADDGKASVDLGTGKVTTTKSKAKAKPKTKAKPKSKAKPKAAKPKADEPKKPRVVKPRASRIVEDKAEAKTLGVDVGTEVKACVDCKNVYPKFGGMFRPRWKNPEAKNENNPDAKADPKHVQPRCIDCDKLRSRRKSRFTGLRRAIGIEDIGDPETIITHPDRKRGGVPDGKFSVALVDDTVDGFSPSLRGALVCLAEGLIRLRWASGDTPEITGATKKAIAAVKAPKVVAPKPKPVKPKATKPKVLKGGKTKPKAKAATKPKLKVRKAKAAKPKTTKAKAETEDNPW